jgi:hypothetical protein
LIVSVKAFAIDPTHPAIEEMIFWLADFERCQEDLIRDLMPLLESAYPLSSSPLESHFIQQIVQIGTRKMSLGLQEKTAGTITIISAEILESKTRPLGVKRPTSVCTSKDIDLSLIEAG